MSATYSTEFHCPTCDAQPGRPCRVPYGRPDIAENGHLYRRWVEAMFQLTGRVIDPRKNIEEQL